MDNGIFFGKKGRQTMTEYDRPLTPRQIRVVKDDTIDFSDIPELDGQFWSNASLVEPDRMMIGTHK